MKINKLINAKLALLALFLASAPANAQTDPGSLERTVPQLEVDPAKRPIGVDAPTLPPQAGTRIAQTFILSAVIIDGATAFDSAELAQSFEPYLASQVGQAELDKIASDITNRYRNAGFLLSYAVVPEQMVQSGIVHINVVEGYVGNVRLVGDGRSAKAVRGIFQRMAAEHPLRGDTLERAIGLGRDVPGVIISDVRISRSAQDPARHMLTIMVGADRFRALGYSDNRGTIEGARVRAYSSFNVASLFLPGDQLQADLFTIPYSKFRYAYGQVKGSVPLNSDGLRLSAAVSYGDQFQRISGPDQNGMSRQLTGEISYPIVESRAISLVGHVQLSDWKSEQERAGRLVQRDRMQVARAWLEFVGAGRLRIDGKIGISRGLDLGSATKLGDLLASRPSTSANFTKFNVAVQMASQLSKRVRIRLGSVAQYSAKPLLAPEEFALGGSRIGRTFDFNEVTGDHGFGAILELGYRLDRQKHLPKTLEIFTFADGGGAFRKRSSGGLPKEQWIAGAGAGARFSALGFLWSAELGVPIARSGADRDARAFFSATKVF